MISATWTSQLYILQRIRGARFATANSVSIAGGERLVWLCGKDTANINPEKPLNLNLDEVYPRLNENFNVRLKSQLALMFDYSGFEVSLFNGGRMLIKGVTDEETALAVYREIMKKISGLMRQ